MQKVLKTVVTASLVVALVVASIGVLWVSVSAERTSSEYTAFYVLGPDGEAQDYPDRLAEGESGTVTVGLENHENERTSYRVVIEYEDETVAEDTVTVGRGGTWEERFTFEAASPGRSPLVMSLYKGDSSADPYRTLQLWVDVTDTSGETNASG